MNNDIDAARLKRVNTLAALGVLFTVILFANFTPDSFAETQTDAPAGDDVTLEKTIALMSVPKDNMLPWGAVSGTVEDPAHGYPVIIQFFNDVNGDDPIHVAQVDVQDDDTYEYKFRVRDVDPETGSATNVFEGDYEVRIFKVVNSSQNLLDAI